MHKGLDSIKSKLAEMQVVSLTDKEIETAFKGCVAEKKLILYAKKYRDEGILKFEELMV